MEDFKLNEKEGDQEALSPDEIFKNSDTVKKLRADINRYLKSGIREFALDRAASEDFMRRFRKEFEVAGWNVRLKVETQQMIFEEKLSQQV